jgi:hypothetical protein
MLFSRTSTAAISTEFKTRLKSFIFFVYLVQLHSEIFSSKLMPLFYFRKMDLSSDARHAI